MVIPSASLCLDCQFVPLYTAMFEGPYALDSAGGYSSFDLLSFLLSFTVALNWLDHLISCSLEVSIFLSREILLSLPFFTCLRSFAIGLYLVYCWFCFMIIGRWTACSLIWLLMWLFLVLRGSSISAPLFKRLSLWFYLWFGGDLLSRWLIE